MDGIIDGPSAQRWTAGLWGDVGCGEASRKDPWGLCSPLWSLGLMPQAQESTDSPSLWRRALRGCAGWGARRAPSLPTALCSVHPQEAWAGGGTRGPGSSVEFGRGVSGHTWGADGVRGAQMQPPPVRVRFCLNKTFQKLNFFGKDTWETRCRS